MPYLHIKDFKNGLDRSRPKANGIPGSLWRAENCVISRGGDVVKAKKFVPLYSLPEGDTFGLALVRNQLRVYASSSVTVPAGISLQVLTAPNTPNLEKILDVKTPGGYDYVIAKFDDGSIHHYYNGTRVSDWDSLVAANASLVSVAAYLAEEMAIDDEVRVTAVGEEIFVEAITPGTAFTLTASATDGGGTNDQTATVTALVANVVEVDNVDAAGSVEITGGSSSSEGANYIEQITVDGTALLSAIVAFSTSASATAALVAQQVNNGTATHGYTATADGATIDIFAPVNTGTTHNGEAVVSTTAGNVTTTDTNLSGGVDYVAPVAQQSKVTFGGTWEADDLFSVTLNGVQHKITGAASAHGTYGLVHKNCIYVAAFNLVYYCELNDYDDFATSVGTATGYGFFGSSTDTGTQRLVGLAKYQGRVAVFSRSLVDIFTLETDATLNNADQALENTGSVSPRSIVSYGNVDVFYLDDTGIRSLRPRDSSNAAYASDIGNLIDDFIDEIRAGVTSTAVRDARAIVDPIDGRYWLALGDRIVLLSSFPGSKISAWTVLQPGYSIDELVKADRGIYVRSGDTVYVYGGKDGSSYVEADECVVELPFLDAGTPATYKHFDGYDMACQGTWKVELLTDPDDDTVAQEIGRFDKQTFNTGNIGLGVEAGIVGVRLTCISDGNASLSQIALHYRKDVAA